MTTRIEKNEARQAERRTWQEKILYASLGGAVLVLAIVTIAFIA